MEEQNPRFTRGTTAAIRSWLLTTVPAPICLCKQFSCNACPGIGQQPRTKSGPCPAIKNQSSIAHKPVVVITQVRIHVRALHEWRYLSNPKPGHTTGGSGWGARRGGGAGPGKTGRRQISAPMRQASLVPPKASKTRPLNDSPEHEQAKSYVNRWRNKTGG